MSGPPSANLMDWSKPALVKELNRLRAVLREHAHQEHDRARSGGGIVGDENPYGRGDQIVDMRGAVLLERTDVVLIDSKQDELPIAGLMLGGRENYGTEDVSQLYVMGTDGAAAVITQLLGLGARAGGRFHEHLIADVDAHMRRLPT